MRNVGRGDHVSFSRRQVLGGLCAAPLLLSSPANGLAEGALPDRLKNDPVAKALGPGIVNAALAEGTVSWYGATTTTAFFDNGGGKRFEDRFGIKVELVNGKLQSLMERLLTEDAVGRLEGDIFLGNDRYMLELYRGNALLEWKPPAPELDRMKRDAFVQDPKGYWWPVHVGTQALLINTDMVKEGQIQSYKDLLDPKWKGKVVIRDPRSVDGGGTQMLAIYNDPRLGKDYIREFVKTVEPVIIQGGTEATKDAVARGQFAIGFSGRGEFFLDLPEGTPLAFLVPTEGLAWNSSSIAILKNALHRNAAKLLMTWFYEVPQLQLWNSVARGVPHPDVKAPIPEMSVANYPMMARIPDAMWSDLNVYTKDMEDIFGIR